MKVRVLATAVLALALSGATARAADPRYPDWPCTQAKVPEISLAAVWAGPPLDDVQSKWKDDAKVSALVSKLSARKTPLDEAEKSVKEFLAGSAADKTANAKLLFAGLFDTLNAQRSQVMRNQSMGLMRAVLRSANLTGLNARDADLSRADLEFASLKGADLTAASLKGAQLGGADLSGATVIGTDFEDADLVSTRLIAPIGLDRAKNFDKAKNRERLIRQ